MPMNARRKSHRRGLLRNNLAVALLLFAPVDARSDTYSSKAACVRASEPAEVCAKQFPEPKTAPRPTAPDEILLLDTCTGIMAEATARMRMAVTYLRFDSMDESGDHHRQARSLRDSADNCARNYNRTSAYAEAEWKAGIEAFRTQEAIFDAAFRAKYR